MSIRSSPVSHAVISASSGEVGDAAARDHRFGGGAAFVDARAADMLALDQNRVVPGVRERLCQWIGSLAGADNDGVVVFECGMKGSLFAEMPGDSED